jgi:hypothetical protein
VGLVLLAIAGFLLKRFWWDAQEVRQKEAAAAAQVSIAASAGAMLEVATIVPPSAAGPASSSNGVAIDVPSSFPDTIQPIHGPSNSTLAGTSLALQAAPSPVLVMLTANALFNASPALDEASANHLPPTMSVQLPATVEIVSALNIPPVANASLGPVPVMLTANPVFYATPVLSEGFVPLTRSQGFDTVAVDVASFPDTIQPMHGLANPMIIDTSLALQAASSPLPAVLTANPLFHASSALAEESVPHSTTTATTPSVPSLMASQKLASKLKAIQDQREVVAATVNPLSDPTGSAACPAPALAAPSLPAEPRALDTGNASTAIQRLKARMNKKVVETVAAPSSTPSAPTEPQGTTSGVTCPAPVLADPNLLAEPRASNTSNVSIAMQRLKARMNKTGVTAAAAATISIASAPLAEPQETQAVANK